MKTETFYPQKITQQFPMEPMHDDYVESMELQDDRLIITYNHLTQGILNPDGTPYYQYDKLTITYRFESYCDFILCSRFKRKEIPFSKVLTLLQTKESHLESYKYMVDSFGELILVFFIHKRNRPCAQLYIKLDSVEITYDWEEEIQRETEDILINDYQFCDLNHFGNILKLYYSEDKQKRIVFFQSHDNTVKARVQSLAIYDCSETKTPIWTGSWSTSQGKNSFYSNINIAFKEYESELQQGYVEVNLNKIPPVDLCNNPEFFAEIEWLKEKDGGRKTIPYGNRYMPQIVIHKFNPNEPLHSILLRNVQSVEEHKTIALVRYVYDTAPNDLYENLVFDVHEGSRKVATGVITSKRENVDI